MQLQRTEIIVTALIIASNINIISFVAAWRATKVSLSLFSFILLWWVLIRCLKLEQSPCDDEKRSRAWYSGRNGDTVFTGPLDHAIGTFVFCIYFWLCWALVAPWAFLWLWRAGQPSSCGASAPHCGGFSCLGPGLQARGLQSSWLLGSRAQVQKLWLTGLAPLQCMGSSQPRDRTRIFYTARCILYYWASSEVPDISILL